MIESALPSHCETAFAAGCLASPHVAGGSFTAEAPAQVIDFDAARRFLHALDPGTKEFTFQTFDDFKERKDPALAQTLHGTLDDLATQLARANLRGAGVYVTVNRTVNRSRRKEDIVAARAMFREADSPDLPPLPIEPHLVVETSPGKKHEYFFIEPTSDFDTWEGVLQTVVDEYGGDPGAKGRNRVLRLPGFFHMKDPAHPHMVKVVHESGGERYTLDELAKVIPPARRNEAPSDRTLMQPRAHAGEMSAYAMAALDGEAKKVRLAPEGQRNDTLNRAAFSIGQLVAGGEIDETTATTALHDAATAAGLPGAEASRTIQSGLDGGSKEPRQVPEKRSSPTHYSAEDLASNPPQQRTQGPDHIAIGHAFLDIEAGGQRAIEYVIDGAIQAGLVVLAAATGVGKTTSVVPLLARVAWLVPDCPLAPKIMRRVIYVTEDSHQVMLILRAMVEAGVIVNLEALKDRFKVLDATRMPPQQWAEIIESYSRYKVPTTRNGITIEAEPLVVVDTKSAVLELEEENSNSENSRAIALIRHTSCPVMLITHIAKALRGLDASLLSARGADSQVADAQQLLTMSFNQSDPNTRWLEIASQKHRFRAAYDGITFELRTANCEVQDVFGQTVIETVAYGHPIPVLCGERDQARRHSEELHQGIKEMILRKDICRAIDQLVAEGSATSKRAIHGVAGGRKSDVFKAIDEMVEAAELVVVSGADAGLSATKKGLVVFLRPGDVSAPAYKENDRPGEDDGASFSE